MVRLGLIAIFLFFGFSAHAAEDLCQDVQAAIKAHDNAGLQKLLAKNPEYVNCANWGPVPILAAASYGDVATLRTLVSYGADPNAKYKRYFETRYQDTYPLIVAAGENTKDVVEFFLSLGASPDVQDSFKETGLMRAMVTKKYDNVVMLLNAGANPNIEAMYGERQAITSVVQSGDIDLVQLFKDHGADFIGPYSNKKTALSAAMVPDNLKVVELLVSYGADVNAVGYYERTPLIDAIYGNCLDCFKYLLAKGADPKYETSGNFPLNILNAGTDKDRGYFNTEFIKAAIEVGLPLNWVSKSGLPIANEFFNSIQWIRDTEEPELVEFINWLAARGYNFDAHSYDANGKRPLFYLMKKGMTLNLVSNLEKHNGYGGCPPVDKNGDSLIHAWSQSHAEEKELDISLKLGCDINDRSRVNDNTPLHLAAMYNPSKMEILIKKGAAATYLNKDGFMPVHFLFTNPRMEYSSYRYEYALAGIQALKAAGSDVNMLSSAGDTAFHLVVKGLARNSYLPDYYLQRLKSHGLDINKPNKYGVKPLKLAKVLNLPKNIIEEMVRAGATE